MTKLEAGRKDALVCYYIHLFPRECKPNLMQLLNSRNSILNQLSSTIRGWEALTIIIPRRSLEWLTTQNKWVQEEAACGNRISAD